MDNKMSMPLEFEDDRVLYMEVDLQAIIPMKFAQNAFSSKNDSMKVVLQDGCSYQMGLRWKKGNKKQLFLIKG
ncbi:uncharacterized protein DS421_10g311490 [Arachis hypogaea]|nr:uncharacterized protein DS421_10g311490 [Arachis hypogaea]